MKMEIQYLQEIAPTIILFKNINIGHIFIRYPEEVCNINELSSYPLYIKIDYERALNLCTYSTEPVEEISDIDKCIICDASIIVSRYV